MTTPRWLAPTLIGALTLALTAGALTWFALRPTAADQPARVKDGIRAPHEKCVDEVTDLSHPWVTDGWWAGRVNGQPREMTTAAAAAMSIAGQDLDGVWICPPKRDW